MCGLSLSEGVPQRERPAVGRDDSKHRPRILGSKWFMPKTELKHRKHMKYTENAFWQSRINDSGGRRWTSAAAQSDITDGHKPPCLFSAICFTIGDLIFLILKTILEEVSYQWAIQATLTEILKERWKSLQIIFIFFFICRTVLAK